MGVLGTPFVIAGVGELTLNVNGGYSFIPAANYNGSVPVVNYTVSNGETTDDSTLNIEVTPVADTFTDNNESVSTLEDSSKSESVLESPNGCKWLNVIGYWVFLLAGLTEHLERLLLSLGLVS